MILAIRSTSYNAYYFIYGLTDQGLAVEKREHCTLTALRYCPNVVFIAPACNTGLKSKQYIRDAVHLVRAICTLTMLWGNWKLSNLESVRIGKLGNWEVSEIEHASN